MPFGLFRSRKLLKDLERRVRDIESLAVRVEQSAQQTQASAMTVARATAESSAAILTIATALPRRRKPRSLRPILAATAAFVIGGFSLTVFGLAGFSDPVPVGQDFAAAQIFVATDSQTELTENTDAKAAVTLYPEYSGSVDYSFWVPAKYAGRKFIIAFETSATLTSVTNSNFEITKNSRLPTCQPEHDEPHTGTDEKKWCQLISGTIPASSKRVYGTCQGVYGPGPSLVQLEISGRSNYEHRSDWAHRQVETPAFPSNFYGRLTDTWYGHDLGGSFSTLLVNSCVQMKMRDNDSLASTDLTDPPKEVRGNYLEWADDAGGSGALITTRSTYVSAFANFVVALGAAIAAVGIGFIPVAYERVSERSADIVRVPLPPSGTRNDVVLSGSDEDRG